MAIDANWAEFPQVPGSFNLSHSAKCNKKFLKIASVLPLKGQTDDV
jgi:hypothetical protein